MATLRGNFTRSGMKRFCKEFCFCFFVPAIMIGAAAVVHYFLIIKAEHGPLEASEQFRVNLGVKVIENTLQGIVTDLIFSAQHNEIRTAFDTDGQPPLDSPDRGLQRFAGREPVYEWEKLLDATGSELVAPDNDGRDATIAATAEGASQDFFTAVWALPRGQVYVSALHGGRERGVLRQPPNSLLQFGTLVFDTSGDKRGVLIRTYRIAELLREFDAAVENAEGDVMLLDGSGLLLRSPRNDKQGLSTERETRTFDDAYPGMWANIRLADSGWIYGPDGLFSFSAAALPWLSAGRLNNLKVVSHVSAGRLGAMARFRQDIPLYVLIFFVVVLVSMMLTGARLKHRKIAAQIEFERQFRETLEDISLLAFGFDADGRITFCNESLLGLTGWQRDELIGKDWLEYLVPTEHRKQYAEQSQRRVTGSELPDPYVAEIQTRDGVRRVISWSDAVFSDNDGRLFGSIRIGKDITESRRTREQLRKLSSAVEQSPTVVMIVDLQGCIDYVNPKFTQATGYTLAEVIGRNPNILKSGETSADEYRELWSTISGGGEWRGVFHNKKKNGELFWEAASISPIRDSAGVITHYLAVKEDITDRKRLEGEVATRNREITKNRELAVMGRMASMIAHDLRNPLSSIKMALQILGERAARIWRKEEDELQRIALEQVGYMEEILEDLLSFSRPDALNPEWVSIGNILDQSVISCQKKIQTVGARLETWYQSGLPTLHADPRKLRQVFSNVIMNALQATEGIVEHTPAITIAVRLGIGAEQPQICVEICDNGRGIGANSQEKLCEPFFTTRARGTGLGLAIVKRIVVQHHGSVSLDAVQEGGTRVVIVLPTGPIDNVTGTERTDDNGVARSVEQVVRLAR